MTKEHDNNDSRAEKGQSPIHPPAKSGWLPIVAGLILEVLKSE